MLEKRNMMAHTYDQEKIENAISLIQTAFYSAIKQVYLTLGLKK